MLIYMQLTHRDQITIRELFHFYRYLPSSIARLYCISKMRVSQIINARKGASYISEDNCLICDTEAQPYYIDGNEDNKNPQNIIKLCEMHRKKFTHLRINKKIKDIKYQS